MVARKIDLKNPSTPDCTKLHPVKTPFLQDKNETK
jgi:hypothetical protein